MMPRQTACDIPPFYVMEVLERAQELTRLGRSIIHLEVGEPDFPTPEHISLAGNRAISEGETKYTHSLGLFELRKAISEHYGSQFGLDISPDRILVTSGTSPALLLLFMGLIDAGDEVIMSNPHYACYPNFVRCLGGKPVFVRTFEEERFEMSPETAASAITGRTKAVIINSPCNPTGMVMSPGVMRGIAEAAGDVPVISDEIYQGIIYEGKDHTILEYTDNAFVLNGFSKLYAMTGWRLGYLIAPPGYMRALQKMAQNFFICACGFVQRAGVAAMNGPEAPVRDMVAMYNKRRRFIVGRLRELGFGVKNDPQGAYYVLANATKFDDDSLELSRSILEEAGVAVTPGIDFGDGAEGYLRFSYANSLDNIREGMSRIEAYLEKHAV
ncbi:MAG TPA: pyridoxal phosphate-dependent aminotransferase [Candidatus Methanoperedenaceae archaeon]|nr:pyridoxal phosphate-dependent aminotransferase [Candidatus Methanoperedenaceae archaeon]